ncbi:MAG: sulfatase-like hydrolase/transferase, partial [Proteiniphilum sp.]
YFYPFCSESEQCLTNLELNDSTYKYLTDRLTNEAVLHIKAAGKQPFFLYLSHYAVHTPIQAKNEIVEKYIRKKKGKRHNNPEYAAMIESLDNSIAKILQALEEENKLNNTIIVFMSDNGGMLHGISDNYPLRGGKGTPYEGGNRIPLIISFGDKIEGNSTNHTNVMGADLFPTLLDLAAIPIAHTVDGISLKNVLYSQHSPESKRDLFFFFPAYLEGYGNSDSFRATPYSSIISEDWKLIRFFEDGHTELYNLKKDIGELTDLSKKYPFRVRDLLTKLTNWEQKVNAPVDFELNPFYKSLINKLNIPTTE